MIKPSSPPLQQSPSAASKYAVSSAETKAYESTLSNEEDAPTKKEKTSIWEGHDKSTLYLRFVIKASSLLRTLHLFSSVLYSLYLLL